VEYLFKGEMRSFSFFGELTLLAMNENVYVSSVTL